jgi:hypothetical protein
MILPGATEKSQHPFGEEISLRFRHRVDAQSAGLMPPARQINIHSA